MLNDRLRRAKSKRATRPSESRWLPVFSTRVQLLLLYWDTFSQPPSLTSASAPPLSSKPSSSQSHTTTFIPRRRWFIVLNLGFLCRDKYNAAEKLQNLTQSDKAKGEESARYSVFLPDTRPRVSVKPCLHCPTRMLPFWRT